jgi:hypothetical protein
MVFRGFFYFFKDLADFHLLLGFRGFLATFRHGFGYFNPFAQKVSAILSGWGGEGESGWVGGGGGGGVPETV